MSASIKLSDARRASRVYAKDRTSAKVEIEVINLKGIYKFY